MISTPRGHIRRTGGRVRRGRLRTERIQGPLWHGSVFRSLPLFSRGYDIPIQTVETGDLNFSFFLIALSGLPRLADSCFAYFSFARRCAGVWACGRMVSLFGCSQTRQLGLGVLTMVIFVLCSRCGCGCLRKLGARERGREGG